jgi:hypothetical protein
MSNETAVAGSDQIVQLVSGTEMQFGSMIKNSGSIVINFPKPFSRIPTVVVTPFWPNGAVGAIETVTAVSTEQFTVASGNGAANYAVNWIAVAP